jgi:uncharacterized protein (TIGR00369 family)
LSSILVEFPTPIPFAELLGLQLLRFAEGQAELVLPMRHELGNSWSVAHGGVLMTLLDVAMSHAARSAALPADPPPGVVTVEMKASFMRPGVGTLHAQGRLLHKTATLAFCEGSVHDAQGLLLAHASGTFKYIKGLPGRGRSIQRLNEPD